MARAENKQQEVNRIKALKAYVLVDIDSTLTSHFVMLMEQYRLCHGLAIPDALNASTALAIDIEFATCNTKHSHFIDQLRLVSQHVKPLRREKGWL